ncbi:MAG: hypothetical protein CMP67_06365 [Flavobacteriales bacterium]|nr:hypothetical protein [Flavobacteriales bacterium]|tara:strand:+ start:1072 stop:3801 length:2730 start_codon:yes stop_codon:yes gene_type:complete
MFHFFKKIALIPLFLCSIQLLAQNPSSVLRNNINKKFLEHLVKKGIDQVRHEHKLNGLVNDSILYLAADFHAKYLQDIKRLSHTENSDSMKTPQNRAEYFGAVNYSVGENILFIPYGVFIKPKKGKPYKIETYQDAADAMVQGWVNSPKHYQNIITPNFEITGVSISIDYSKNRIYAVQKFAEVFFKYEFEENKDFFKYSDFKVPDPINSHEDIDWGEHSKKYPYKIKPLKKDKNYENDIAKLKKSIGFQRIRVEKNSIYLEMDLNAAGLLEFIEKDKDGLAIEYINYMPFDCGNEEYYTLPSRRNGKHQLSDTLLIPVYRKDLIKGFKPKRKSTKFRILKEIKKKDKERKLFKKIIDGYRMPYYPDRFRYRIAKIPKKVKSGFYEMNLVYIKNKQIYYIQHFSGVCGEFHQEFNELEYISDFGEKEYVPIPQNRDLNFAFRFKKGKTNYSYKDLKPALDSLTNDEFIVLSADIDAFSSVEGSNKINSEIQKKRAESIVKALESKQSKKIQYKIETHSNWELFKTQIDSFEALSHLKDLDSVALASKLKDPKFTKPLERYLSKQRTAKVYIKTLYDLNDRTLSKFLRNQYVFHQNRLSENSKKLEENIMLEFENEDLKNEIKSKINSDLDTLKSILLFTFNKIKEGKLDTNIICELDYLGIDWTSPLFLNHFFMEDYFKIPTKKRRFNIQELSVFADLDNFYPKGAYNYLRYVIKEWDGEKELSGFKTEEIQYLLEEIGRTHRSLSSDLEKLKINFWFKAAEYHFKKKEVNKKNEYLLRIFLHYKDKNLDELYALKLAKFFVHFENFSHAVSIIEKFHDTTTNQEVIAYIYKLKYYNNIEYNKNEFAESCIKIRERLTKENWCKMFVGSCNISFQVFDHEKLRNFYCSECSEYKNEIQSLLSKKIISSK